MICKNCGRTVQNEEANFCEYCGAPFRPGMDYRVLESAHLSDTSSNGQGVKEQQGLGQGSDQNAPWSSNYGQSPYGSNSMNRQAIGDISIQNSTANRQKNTEVHEKPMTLGNWLAVMLIFFIPPIGPYAFLALLFFWSFSKSVSLTKKNWARATLIVFLILLVLVVMMLSMTGGAILSDPTAILNSLYGK